MYLTVSDVAPGEVRLLFCSNQRLRREVAATDRAHRLPNGNGSTRLDAEPTLRADTKVEESCPACEVAPLQNLQID